MQTKHQLEEQLTFQGVAQRRITATNASLNRQLAGLESEIDQLITAHGALGSVLARKVQAVDQLSEIEAKRKAAEIVVATLALQQEVLKSKHAASRAMLASRSELDETVQILTADTEVASPVMMMAKIGEGLYAFTSLNVPGSSTLITDDLLASKSTAMTKTGSDRTANASVPWIATPINGTDASPDTMPVTSWADAQFELGKSLAAAGRQSSGTHELQNAVLAFKAAASEWSRSQAPLKWAAVHFELGRTLALLSRRLGDPAFRTASIEALNESLSVSSQAEVVTSAEAARRLLDELTIEKTNMF